MLGLLLAAGLASVHADQVLFDFTPGFDLERVSKSNAEVQMIPAGAIRALRIKTGIPQKWPGVTLPVPESGRDLSAFGQVELRVRNVGTNRVTVNCRVDNPGADGANHCATGRAAVEPGASQTLRVPLKRASYGKLDGKLFGLRGYPVTPGGPGTVDPKHITQILLFVNEPGASHTFDVQDIRATGSHTPPTASVTDADAYFPFIDTYGQYKHRDWPWKVHSPAELAECRANEAKELAAQPGPPDWDQYGGWKNGPQLAASGFFRVEKYCDRWWFVGPGGRLFWSHGIDCVRMLDATSIDERAGWFADFAGDNADFREFLSSGFALKGHYAGRSPKTFSFSGANLRRKYGDIAKLNISWSTRHRSWDALLQSREAPDRKQAHADLTTFYTKARRALFPHRTQRHQSRRAEPALPRLPVRVGERSSGHCGGEIL